MKKRKNILIICLIILIVLVITITCMKIWSLKEVPTSQENSSPSLDDFKQVEACSDEENCPNFIFANYANIKYDYDDEDMQQWIENINKETEQYYQETLNSNPIGSNCPSEIQENFKYSIMTETKYHLYSGERYISLAVRRLRINLCTHEKKATQIDVYLYDKDLKRRITQDEIKNALNVPDVFVAQAISRNITSLNTYSKKNFTLEDTYKDGVLDYVLYYNSSGKLMASYYQNSEQVYYSTVVLEN